MTCDLIIRSYYKDFKWLRHCLRSIERYCRGFEQVILVVPSSSAERLEWVGLRTPQTFYCPDFPDDYLGQQVTKLLADNYSKADYVCHVDSDCLFQSPVTPADLFELGKVRLFKAPYPPSSSKPSRQTMTEKFMRRPVPYNFMLTQPQIFPRWIYGKLRRWTEATHGVSLSEYVMAQAAGHFSEFNALGAYAYYYHRERFSWVDVSNEPGPEYFCKCFWSWGGIPPAIARQIRVTLGDS